MYDYLIVGCGFAGSVMAERLANEQGARILMVDRRDHIGGNAEKALRGEMVPQMVAGHTYWKNGFLPAGVCALVTPMNFIYGISVIQIIGCYMSGSPMIFKGHPFGGICNTVMMRMLLAAGAGGGTDRVVLAGVAGTQLFSALTSFIVISSADAEQTRGVLFWLLGHPLSGVIDA